MAKPQKNAQVPAVVANGKYRLEKRIGGGSFGEIYKGAHTTTNELFAVKLEPVASKIPQLLYECKLYKHLSGGVGIPVIKWCGTEANYNIMVMELLGKSLEDLMCDKSRPHFSLKSAIMVVDQIICRLEYLHNKDYIHRDIKPDNFIMGKNANKKTVYMIDFGLAKRYRDSSTHQHIPFKDGRGMTGTVRYASINSQQGMEQGRRDDLESVGYISIYFITGTLPWQGLKIDNRNAKFRAICDMKMSIPVDQLCKECPPEIMSYMKYVKDLAFDAKPDYNYLRKLLRAMFMKNSFTLDYIYDWTVPEGQEEKEDENKDIKKKKKNEDGETIESSNTRENNASQNSERSEGYFEKDNTTGARSSGGGTGKTTGSSMNVSSSTKHTAPSKANNVISPPNQNANLPSSTPNSANRPGRSESPTKRAQAVSSSSAPNAGNAAPQGQAVPSPASQLVPQPLATVPSQAPHGTMPVSSLTQQQQQQLLFMEQQMKHLLVQAQTMNQQLQELYRATQQQVNDNNTAPSLTVADKNARNNALITQYNQQSIVITANIDQIKAGAKQLFDNMNLITNTLLPPSTSSPPSSSSSATTTSTPLVSLTSSSHPSVSVPAPASVPVSVPPRSLGGGGGGGSGGNAGSVGVAPPAQSSSTASTPPPFSTRQTGHLPDPALIAPRLQVVQDELNKITLAEQKNGGKLPPDQIALKSRLSQQYTELYQVFVYAQQQQMQQQQQLYVLQQQQQQQQQLQRTNSHIQGQGPSGVSKKK